MVALLISGIELQDKRKTETTKLIYFIRLFIVYRKLRVKQQELFFTNRIENT